MTDSVRALMSELASRRVTIRAVEGQLGYRPREVVDSDPALKARLQAHKRELLELVASGVDEHEPETPACGLCTFMNEAEGGNWTCPNCSMRKPPPPAPTDWDAETSSLVAWFVDQGSRLLPTKPFDLYPWARVTDPARYRDAIVFDISLGPDDPRNRHGALLTELKRLWELFGEVAT